MKCAVLAALAAVAAASRHESPIQHLVSTLKDMAQQTKNERDEEEKTFTVAVQERSHSLEQTEGAIEENQNKITMLKAEIDQGAANIADLSKDILDLDTLIDKSERDDTAATNVRDLDASDHQAEATDLEDTISAVKRAKETLQAVNKNTGGEAALVELKSQIKVASAAAMLEQAMAPHKDTGNAFESKTGGVIGVLEDIESKMNDELYAAQKAETESLHAYKLLKNELERTIKDSKELNSKKQGSLAEAKQQKATAEADKTDAEETLKNDQQYASDLKATMANDQNTYESRQKVREDEIAAIEEAVKILSQTSTAMLFVQIREKLSAGSTPARVVEFLTKRGNAIHSTLLTQLATAAQAPDAFAKIKKMINDLIVKLMEEATAETSHQGWCDTELETNKMTRADKSDAVVKGSAAIDQLNANINDAQDNISELNEALAQLSKDQANAAETRQEEHNLNTETIKTAEADLELLAKAKAVLEEFYNAAASRGTASGTTGGVQQAIDNSDPAQNDAGAGVIAIIMEIENDTSSLVSATKVDEENQQNAFEQNKRDAEVDQTQKQTTLQNTQNKLAEFENSLASETKELKDNQKGLDDANRYYEKLKPSCVDAGVSFEERTARRKEEIESLQEALKILSGDSDF